MSQFLEARILQFATMITDPSLKALYYKHFNISATREGEIIKKKHPVKHPVSIVDELKRNNFDGADIHWFHCYFKITLLNSDVTNWEKATLMIINGTLEDIQKAINKGKIGKTI